ncbi:MAG: hypothetical protein V1740_08535 [Candidatus Woesearchaeota archaeon]
MKKWKYSKPRAGYPQDTFLRIPEGKKTRIKMKRFEITKKAMDDVNKTIFQGDVIEVDGEKIERIWTIFNYNNVMDLKKKLARMKGNLELDVIRHVDEDTMEDYYEYTIIKESE